MRSKSWSILALFTAIVTASAGAAPPGAPPETRIPETAIATAAQLREQAQQGSPITLIVSSDMTHYQPHAKAAAQDSLALDAIAALDPPGLLATVRSNKISMCGVLPMVMALFACRALGAAEGRVIAYATSGQTGKAYGADMNSVVGYAGVAILP